MNFISQKEYDKVKIKDGNILKDCVILKDNNAIVDEFYNFYTKKIVPNPVVRKIVVEKQRGCCQTTKKTCQGIPQRKKKETFK